MQGFTSKEEKEKHDQADQEDATNAQRKAATEKAPLGPLEIILGFGCSHKDCEKLGFSTSKNANRHVLTNHGLEDKTSYLIHDVLITKIGTAKNSPYVRVRKASELELSSAVDKELQNLSETMPIIPVMGASSGGPLSDIPLPKFNNADSIASSLLGLSTCNGKITLGLLNASLWKPTTTGLSQAAFEYFESLTQENPILASTLAEKMLLFLRVKEASRTCRVNALSSVLHFFLDCPGICPSLDNEEQENPFTFISILKENDQNFASSGSSPSVKAIWQTIATCATTSNLNMQWKHFLLHYIQHPKSALKKIDDSVPFNTLPVCRKALQHLVAIFRIGLLVSAIEAQLGTFK